jgi:hypothetical protein
MRRPRSVALLAASLVGVALVGCGPTVPGGTCPMFPADSHWHASVAALPVSTRSAALVSSIGSTAGLKADFGSGEWDGGPIGIPWTSVPAGQAKVAVSFDYDDESDPGPYPIPANAPVEGGPASTGDRHVIVVDQGACRLYELFDAHRNTDGTWHAGSGSVWDLASNNLRPAGWTSADAAGLPILPGLVRYDEVASGTVDHAIRITVPRSVTQYLWPARHQAGSTSDLNVPAMGQRLRLKASVDLTRVPASVRPILQALKTYGAVVADNGSPWFISGVPDSRWDNDALHALGTIKGSDFEAVDATSLMVSPNSGQAKK